MSLFRWTGIDLGSYSIKIVQISGAPGKGFTLNNLFSIRRDELVQAAGSRDPESMGLALAERISSSSIRVSEGVISSTSREGIIRYIKVPTVPPWRLKIIMEYEIAEIAGKTGENITADYLVLPNPDLAQKDNMLAMVGLVKNELMDEKLALLQSAQLGVTQVTPSCLGLYNSFLHLGDIESDEVTLLLDIGHENTDMVVHLNRDLLFARSLSLGGKNFTQAVQEVTGKDFHDADRAKIAEGTLQSRGGDSQVNDALHSAANQFASVINSSIGFCRAQIKKPKMKIDRILLSGGGAHLDGLDEYLAKTLKTDVEIFNPLATMDTSSLKGTAKDKAKELAPEIASALGIAISNQAQSVQLNLLPYEYKKKHEFKTRTVFMMAAGVVLAVYIVLSLITAISLRSKAAASLEKIDSQQTLSKNFNREYTSLKERNQEAVKVIQTLHTTANPGMFAVQLMDGLNKSVPNGVTLKEFEMVKPKDSLSPTRQFKVICYADNSNRQAAQMIDSLIGSLKKLSFVAGTPKSSTPQTGRNKHEWKVTLEITCQ